MSYSFLVNLLHLATGKNGGARLAAEQLVKIQRLHDDNATIIPAISDQPDKYKRSQYKNVMSKASTFSQKIITKTEYGLVSTLSVSSIPPEILESRKIDLVHIHNWFNLVSLRDFKILSKKVPLVFTLHDQRLGTGGCHYTFGCKNNSQECKNCPAVKFGHSFVQRSKVKTDEIFSEIKSYGVIAPSNWILSELKNQPIIKNAKSVDVIPNITEFQAQKKDVTKNVMHRRRFELLFVASEINQPVKGLLLLLNCLNNISHMYPELHLNIVGRGNLETKMNFSYTYHGFLSRPKLVNIMNKSSICVVPSLMDNLPSVIIEAIRNRCIVISTDVGGIGDIIIDRQTGFLIQPNQVLLQEKIAEVFNLSHDSQDAIRQNALIRINEKYNNDEIYLNHKKLYNEILSYGV
jgi:glycosyltransferase involved in cell wall biosynthesis